MLLAASSVEESEGQASSVLVVVKAVVVGQGAGRDLAVVEVLVLTMADETLALETGVGRWMHGVSVSREVGAGVT